LSFPMTAMAGMRAMPSDSTFSLSRTKLYDSTVSRGSMAASSSTRRRTCSDSGSARAWENTASRTGSTSRANSSLSWEATSSVISGMRETSSAIEYSKRPSAHQDEPGGQRQQRDRHPDLQVLGEAER